MKKQKKQNKIPRVSGLILFKVCAITFISLFISFSILTLATLLAVQYGNIQMDGPQPGVGNGSLIIPLWAIILLALGVSVISGLTTCAYLLRIYLKPLKELKKLTNAVTTGDYSGQIDKKDIPDGEIGQYMESFNQMVKELNKKEILKFDFVSNVSHEFKTPLATIQGYAELLDDDNVPREEKIKYIDYIKTSTTQLANLVDTILKISKIDDQKIIINPETYSLDEQLRESLISLESLWSEKEIELSLKLFEAEVYADKNLMLNVWNNIINNAIKYSKQGGILEINLLDENDYYRVDIVDHGYGIASEDIPYLFEKFFQAKKSHKEEGHGLGLALAKLIIDINHGKIKVKSKINEGSTFSVYLLKEKPKD